MKGPNGLINLEVAHGLALKLGHLVMFLAATESLSWRLRGASSWCGSLTWPCKARCGERCCCKVSLRVPHTAMQDMLPD